MQVKEILKVAYNNNVSNKDLLDKLTNENLFSQEDLAEFIIEVFNKGILKDYVF